MRPPSRLRRRQLQMWSSLSLGVVGSCSCSYWHRRLHRWLTAAVLVVVAVGGMVRNPPLAFRATEWLVRGGSGMKKPVSSNGGVGEGWWWHENPLCWKYLDKHNTRRVVARGAVAIHFAGSRIFLVDNLVKLTVHRPFRRVYKFVHCIYQIEPFFLFQQVMGPMFSA